MKKNVLKISILPLMFLVALSFAGLQPQKDDKGNKGNGEGRKGNPQSQGNKGNKNEERSWDGPGKEKKDQDDRGMSNSGDRGNQKNKFKDDPGHGKDKNHGNDIMSKNGKDKNNGNGKSRKETIRWDRASDIPWGFDNYASRKGYKNYKKVTICHNTGNDNYPVTISVSENAMRAHLNHGDQMGDCRINFSDRWPARYVKSREKVYNSYENTWENISYSEALLRFAAEKLLGVKSTFQTQRPNLTSQEIQRKEMVIMELQNNVNSLENQLNATRQRTDGININVML